ncbi:MAG: helix-hairpin-helix domain-containing protein [Flavobacterium sp.]|nr:MAG: helix-hairpin-helix domain-containing protein [Flavobacterium sp.]
MNSLKPYFTFTASQRSGLFALFLLIGIMQCAILSIENIPEDNSREKQQWLALQPEIDALKKQQHDFTPKVYPFNPNFITDFKGYKLGMSTDEIDRLLAFRKSDKYVNSAEEFQSVTKVSDSLLAVISPYFKFPDWVKNSKRKTVRSWQNTDRNYQTPTGKRKFAANKVMLDINTASQEDLMKVYGIGPALSERILKQREALGGFVSMEQMNDVWGLSPEVVEKLLKQFKVAAAPNVKKIAVNNASVRELSQFPYFRYPLSKEIVTYRSMNGSIKDAEDLKKIKGFPLEKVSIIAVYLEF